MRTPRLDGGLQKSAACLGAAAPPAASSTALAHRANPARSLAARAQAGGPVIQLRGGPRTLRPSSSLASRDVGGLRPGLAERQGASQSGDDPAASRGE